MMTGDRVRVYWEHLEPIEGEVRYIPCRPGDTWIIYNGAIRATYYVQTFCMMRVLEPLPGNTKSWEGCTTY